MKGKHINDIDSDGKILHKEKSVSLLAKQTKPQHFRRNFKSIVNVSIERTQNIYLKVRQNSFSVRQQITR